MTTNHCPIVFDYIVPISKPRARRTDPQTSHDAAEKITASECDAIRKAIKSVLFWYGNKTCSEISNYLQYDKVQIGRRIGEVKGIQPSGLVRNGERVWALI